MGAYASEATKLDVEVVNTEQAAAWDGHEGDVWTEHADRYDRANRRYWQRLLAAGLITIDDAVLDIGCGTGWLTRDAARVASNGSVLGIDLSTKMLDLARQRAAEAHLANVTFRHGDAQVFRFQAQAFDVAMSSFGAMFFNDPIAAFANIGGALRPGGTLALLAWRSLQENEWLMSLRAALAVGRELPDPPPDAPTPFALADPDRVRAILSAAGLEAIELAPVDEPIDFGADGSDALAFATTMGIVEGLTNGLDPDDRATAISQLAELLRRHESADGVLLSSAAWLITARK